MVLAIVGALILLGAVRFLESNGKRRPLWHWIVLAISILAVTTLVILWVGEYRFENRQPPHISN